MGVGHRNTNGGNDAGGLVGCGAVEGRAFDPEAVERRRRSGPPVPGGFDLDGGGNDEGNGTGPLQIPAGRSFNDGEDPPMLPVGRVGERLDCFVVEDNRASWLHAAASARPAA